MTNETKEIYATLSPGDAVVLTRLDDAVEYVTNIAGVVSLRTAYLEK